MYKRQEFELVISKIAWMNKGVTINSSVQTPILSYSNINTSFYTDELKTASANGSSLGLTEKVYVVTTVTNNGNVTWNNANNAIWFKTDDPRDRLSEFCDPAWSSCSRLTPMNESIVAPGETATFEFWWEAPRTKTGNYNEHFRLVMSKVAWLSGPDIVINTLVQ